MALFRRVDLSVRPDLFAALLVLSSAVGGCSSDGAAPPSDDESDLGPSTGDDDADDDADDDDAPRGGGKADAGKRDAGGGGKSPSKDGGAGPQTPGTSKDGGSGGKTTKGGIPCDVAKVLETHCAECHGDPPNFGGPMSLVDHDDFHIDGVKTKTQKVDALVKARVNDTAKPMPPKTAPPMSAADKKILNDWLTDGAPEGDEGDSCIVKTPDPKPDDGAMKPLPPDAKCFELRNHGKPVSGDTSPYGVATGEHYAEFFFDAPWKEPSVMVGFRTLHDNTKVLHHWLMYKTNGREADGAISSGIGSHIGGNVQLLAGWAVGGNDMKLPDGIAAVLPPPGGKMMIEWHYFNSTPTMQMDRSGVEVCVVPASKVDPAKTASLTWVGNENLGGNSLLGVIGAAGMPPQKETKIQDICTPRYANVKSGEPVRIFSFTPHMHQLGRHMRTWVARKDGTVEKVFDNEFEFDHQLNYNIEPFVELWPGDRLVNECTFFNNTNAAVGFGPSSTQEMCYQFTYAYPAGALQNGVSSLTGATNTCWDNKQAEAAQLIAKSKN